ncbi:MAG TPA: histidinol-phosphate transaminase [Trueperaceae bacterium]|nr:histidinol-phosphate transaminase [Trueperaceae bacterium]
MVIRDEVGRLPAYRFSHHPQPVKLDQNEAPDDLAGPLRAAVMRRLEDAVFNRYPELHPLTLERAIALRHDWDPAGVVVANGSNVLIQALVILSGLGRDVVSVTPTFAVYAAQARIMGAHLSEYPLSGGFKLPLSDLLQALAVGSGVMFLADPAAPSGNRHASADLAALVRAASARGTWLSVIDEAYCEYAGSDDLALVRDNDAAVSLRTFSKAAGLAGLRLGYALTSPEVAAELRKVLLPFSVGTLQVAVGLTVLEQPEIIAERVARVVAERERLVRALAAQPGVEVFPSVTNFLLFKVPEPARVHAGLLERGVVIRRQDHLPGAEGCLRVSVGTEHENDVFLGALNATLSGEVVHG